MSLKYLGGASWAEITREERFFCARLYELVVRHGVSSFVLHLNATHNAGLDAEANWELAYEACFYRDLHRHRRGKGRPFSPKRTFDLALFSDDTIVVFEAKAHGEFGSNQLRSLERDSEQLKKETGVSRVMLAALSASAYVLPARVASCFDGPRLTWVELAKLFGDDPVLVRADAVYESRSARSYGRRVLMGT